MSRVARAGSKRSLSAANQKSSSRSTQPLLQAPPKFERQWRMQLDNSVTAIAWSATGEDLAVTSAAGELWWGNSHRPLNPVLKAGEQAEGAATCVEFSQDGQYLARSGQFGQVTVWSLSGPTPTVIFDQRLTKDWVDCLRWHPTQAILAIGVGPTVQLLQMATQTLMTQLDFERSSVLALAWHPEGRYLAVSGHGGVSVWSAKDWTAVPEAGPEFIAVPGASIAVQWSTDGRYLGSGNLDHTLTVVDWGQPPPWFMQGFPGKVRQLSWSSSQIAIGSPLLAAACADGVTVWQQEADQDGIWQSRVLKKHTQTVKAIAFQPHTLTLASAGQDGQLILWHRAKSVAQVLKGAKQGWSAIAWSPSGDAIAAGGQAGELILWTPSSRGRGFQS